MKNMKTENLSPCPSLKIEAEPWPGEDTGFQVEFEVLPADDPHDKTYSAEEVQIKQGLADVENRLESNADRLSKLNTEIDRLTNHADGIDYATAVICGLIAGVIDSIYVGAWDFAAAKQNANIDINRQIEEYAKKCGYEDKGGGLKGAVKYLEEKFKMPGDNDWKFVGSGVSASSHHLDDFCHHPNLVGLICCIIVQFTGSITYRKSKADTGEDINITKEVTVNTYDGLLKGESPIAKVFCGVVNWFIVCAKTMANARGHWMSDLAGSSQSAGKGAGLPGSFISLMKELSTFFPSKDNGKGQIVNPFAEAIRKAYQNGIGSKKSQVDLGPFNCLFEGASSKFDVRTEQAVKNLLKKQMVPVMVNEALVRGSYFVRHLVKELHEKKSFAGVSWRNVLPFGNRTIARMMTIATGTFTACDLADATIRSGIGNGFNVYNPKFWSDIILRVNFVGVGRFAVAVATDVGMGIKLQNRHWDKIIVQTEHIHLLNARVQYKMADAWVQAENTDKAIQDFQCVCGHAWAYWQTCWMKENESLRKSVVYINKIDEKCLGFRDEVIELLEEP